MSVSDNNYDSDHDAFFNTAAEADVLVQKRAMNKRKRENSELDRYMYAGREDLHCADYVTQPLAWWRDYGERMFPHLAILAYTLLAIPGMSAECSVYLAKRGG
jgi:hypothetical protein